MRLCLQFSEIQKLKIVREEYADCDVLHHQPRPRVFSLRHNGFPLPQPQTVPHPQHNLSLSEETPAGRPEVQGWSSPEL